MFISYNWNYAFYKFQYEKIIKFMENVRVLKNMINSFWCINVYDILIYYLKKKIIKLAYNYHILELLTLSKVS